MISVSKRALFLSILSSLLSLYAKAHQGFEEQDQKVADTNTEEIAESAKQAKFFDRLDRALKNEKG